MPKSSRLVVIILGALMASSQALERPVSYLQVANFVDKFPLSAPSWPNSLPEPVFLKDIELQQPELERLPLEPGGDMIALGEYYSRQNEWFQKMVWNFNVSGSSKIFQIGQYLYSDLEIRFRALEKARVNYIIYGHQQRHKGEATQRFYEARQHFNQVCHAIAEVAQIEQNTAINSRLIEKYEACVQKVAAMLLSDKSLSSTIGAILKARNFESPLGLPELFTNYLFDVLLTEGKFITEQDLMDIHEKHSSALTTWSQAVNKYQSLISSSCKVMPAPVSFTAPSIIPLYFELIGKEAETITQQFMAWVMVYAQPCEEWMKWVNL
ncbi:hypothetical protein [Candidatus Odyssella thessalonicensis]|uniref:hypothetical protein n=1 Tax=Candidatus Odyssella thessalonicensis TaxID=84647 RepID=UPI000225AF61|nr:hypothetical protein [Candidatus Odyssella thessalonicensis]